MWKDTCEDVDVGDSSHSGQGAKGIRVTAVTVVESVVRFELPQIGGSYEGKIDAGATSIEGTWSQSGNNLPLAWKLQGGR